MAIIQLVDEWAKLDPATWAQGRFGWITEAGQPVTLADWQRAVISEYWQRRQVISTLFISTVKKSGKTFLNSLLAAHRWLTLPGVHFALGNDQDQAALLQSAMIADMIKRHPVLRRYVKINRNELVFTPTGSRLITLPSDYQGSAGHNFLTVSFTELWAFIHEGPFRMYEELTPPPLSGALRLVDSYAGWEGESLLLRQIWDRGLSGERINDDWPIFLVGQQLSYIHQGEEAQIRCWRGSEEERIAYYAEQAAGQRQGTFNRHHLNQWQNAESVFITPEQWDALIDLSYRCPLPGKSTRLYVAYDMAVVRDWAAVVSVFRDGDLLKLGPYRVWKPGKKRQEIDQDAVEEYLISLADNYTIADLRGDDTQFASIRQRLNRSGIKTEKFSQHANEMTKAGNALYDTIRQTRLVVYPGADDLRTCVLNARGKETERGVRLVKQTQSRKIDAAIALAMAVSLALDDAGKQWRNIPFLPVPGNEYEARIIQALDLPKCPRCNAERLQPSRSDQNTLQCRYCGFIRREGERIPQMPTPAERLPWN